MVLGLLPTSVFNSSMSVLQRLRYQRKIEMTKIEEPPIFIIGHWRSGTTYLHELMTLDDRLGFPSTYDCFAPYHFLVTSQILPWLLRFLLPKKRPMDNVAVGLDRPQEDEFALCAMGAPSPYYRMAFPNSQMRYLEFLNMEEVDEQSLRRFRSSLDYFVRALTLAQQKRLIMKSPLHTCRIALLAEMFPGARFVHMTRDPYAIFASTRRLWSTLDATQGFQPARKGGLDEYIFECLPLMYQQFERQRAGFSASTICQLRYEDLVRDPVREVARLYPKLELGHFENVRPQLLKYLEQEKDYQPNRHHLEPEIKKEIGRRWADYFERYDYQRES